MNIQTINSLQFGKIGKEGKGHGRGFKRSNIIKSAKTSQIEAKFLRDVNNTYNSTGDKKAEELNRLGNKFFKQCSDVAGKMLKGAKKYK